MLKDKDIGYVLHKAAMLTKCNFTNKLNNIGITPGQLAVLKELYKDDTINHGLSPACIAARLECDRPTISGIIDRLEAQGWVRRLHNPDDKRSVFIIVTDKAMDKLKDIEEIRSENRNIILKNFTEEEKQIFRDYLLRVVDNFRDIE